MLAMLYGLARLAPPPAVPAPPHLVFQGQVNSATGFELQRAALISYMGKALRSTL